MLWEKKLSETGCVMFVAVAVVILAGGNARFRLGGFTREREGGSVTEVVLDGIC